MRIWLINHYAVPPSYYPLARQTNFAKHLMKRGHDVTIISASSVHNSDINLIEDDSPYRRETVDGVDHVYVKCCDYNNNGIKRIYNMQEFAWKLPAVCKKLERPDAVVSTSMPPMSCAKGVRIAKKYGAVAIAEIADLWPESIIAYGIAGPNNPAVRYLRRMEKWIYKNADRIVFTMGGGYDYIKDQKWEDEIPASKVAFINNGVDLAEFDYNKTHYTFEDEDLDDESTFKIIYTGSLRQANEQIKPLFDAIKLMQTKEYEDYRFLIYGKGEMEDELRELCQRNGYDNVRIKGFVDKKFIPYILSKCDLNILNCEQQEILRYGGSQNKLFDYLASGKPIITGEESDYSVVKVEQCGIAKNFKNAQEIVDAITKLKEDPIPYEHIREVGEKYDFGALTDRLLAEIEGVLSERQGK